MVLSGSTASWMKPCAALLKRWLIGMHQGAVSRAHLDYYPDEYTFRLGIIRNA